MTEPVRLVIWDLDETFWLGTLSEGGITYRADTHGIVIELAKRGIMSSICSKNDFDTVRKVLSEKNIWDYFIFPSISWEPKGHRIKFLVESVQLRPESVMFIDDNPMNLNEALFFLPGLQVAEENLIPTILSDSAFAGKSDPDLKRLMQYKVLEKKKMDQIKSTGNLDFLKGSGIKLVLDHDVERNLDRVIDLVNRTNQLNFTKRRLPNDLGEAKAELSTFLKRFDIQAGTVRVFDKYGDYGICGFFAVQIVFDKQRLIHFCFSCRILNMGVEAFVFNLLGRPQLNVSGEVLSDPTADPNPDWIEMGRQDEMASPTNTNQIGGVYLRGGCDMMILAHYSRMVSSNVTGEYNTVRGHLQLRIDHTLFTKYAIQGVQPEALESFCRLGYAPEDFRSELFQSPKVGTWILSFFPDFWVPLYKHNLTGQYIPFYFSDSPGVKDPTSLSPEERRGVVKSEKMLEVVDLLATEFTYSGYIQRHDFEENLDLILSTIPSQSKTFIVMAKEFYGQVAAPKSAARPTIDVNNWTRGVASRFPNVTLVPMADFVKDPDDVAPDNHLRRLVYLRMFEYIRDLSV